MHFVLQNKFEATGFRGRNLLSIDENVPYHKEKTSCKLGAEKTIWEFIRIFRQMQKKKQHQYVTLTWRIIILNTNTTKSGKPYST